jgi:hypothetical protein
MQKIKQFGVFIFNDDTEEGPPLKRADNPEECATFSDPMEALREMNERCIDYGIRTEVVDLDCNAVLLETTDQGQTWCEPKHARRTTNELTSA